MLLLSAGKLPQGPDWLYEIKLDGYRALAIKAGGGVQLRSRNDNDFTARYAPIMAALRALPDETVVDSEVVALDEEGRPFFNLLHNFGTSRAHLALLVFDVLMLEGRDVTGKTLEQRRRLLEEHILTRLTKPIHYRPFPLCSQSGLLFVHCEFGRAMKIQIEGF